MCISAVIIDIDIGFVTNINTNTRPPTHSRRLTVATSRGLLFSEKAFFQSRRHPSAPPDTSHSHSPTPSLATHSARDNTLPTCARGTTHRN